MLFNHTEYIPAQKNAAACRHSIPTRRIEIIHSIRKYESEPSGTMSIPMAFLQFTNGSLQLLQRML